MAAATPLKVRRIECPNCGGNVELRGFQNTRSAVCIQCLSVLDPTTPEVTILQRFDERMRVPPILPLGKRGKIQGVLYEVIGFQQRTITVDETDYSWHEYLLFNPYQGFRYLIQYNGHWSFVTTLQALPAFTTLGGRRAATYQGRTYKHFQSAQAATTFVMGEFPWQVQVGETVQADDYIAPPYMLSAEITEGEVNWSHGEYMTGQAVWQIFQMPGTPPPAQGIYANQPAPPTTGVRDIWSTFLKLFLAWIVLLFGIRMFSANEQVHKQELPLANHESVVTEPFELKGRDSNAEIELRTDGPGYFHMALVNQQSGRATEFARNVGGRDAVILPDVPAGRYYLRIDPEIDNGQKLQGTVSVRRDVPGTFWLWLALPLLLIPPIVRSARAGSFEAQRWQESDYAS